MEETNEVKKLEERVAASVIPQDLKEKINGMIQRLKAVEKERAFTVEFDRALEYIDWVLSLPWKNSTKDILDLNHARQVLDNTHYGLREVKDQILELLSVMIIKNSRNIDLQISHAPIISLVGLPGTGKTTIAFSIAQAMGRKIERIPFGGMGGSITLRGQSRVYPDAEPGLIVKALRRAQTNNPVILLDEIDRISNDAKSDIMGVLVELLDPEQNKNFTDHFIDFSFDLSNVLFIATSNNTKDIAPAVIDRLELIQMPSYSDQEKMVISKSYMFPQILRDSGLTESDLLIDDEVWSQVTRPLGYDPGMRSMQRTIQGVVRKVAMYIVEGKIKPSSQFKIGKDNAAEFLPDW